MYLQKDQQEETETVMVQRKTTSQQQPVYQQQAVKRQPVMQLQGELGQHLAGTQIHWDSSEPAKVGAHAFAQGKEVHVATGQEQHIYHELGHVVQQSRGHVPATTQYAGLAINDDPALETGATDIGREIAKELTVKKGDNYIG